MAYGRLLPEPHLKGVNLTDGTTSLLLQPRSDLQPGQPEDFAEHWWINVPLGSVDDDQFVASSCQFTIDGIVDLNSSTFIINSPL